MWQFNWSVFWAILAALAVRRVAVFIWDAAAGESVGSLNTAIGHMNRHLVQIRDELQKK
jgi:hypothetical protein